MALLREEAYMKWAACSVRVSVKRKFKINFKSKVKGVGQECPTHTSIPGGNLGSTLN
jgi:hypothetical protein